MPHATFPHCQLGAEAVRSLLRCCHFASEPSCWLTMQIFEHFAKGKSDKYMLKSLQLCLLRELLEALVENRRINQKNFTKNSR